MMPSKAAKKARTWRMKCCSVVETLSQSVASAARSISSAVQNFGLLVHLPDVVVLDGEQDETMEICL
jgi:ABC-type uncharacterized transport system ATPase subunit